MRNTDTVDNVDIISGIFSTEFTLTVTTQVLLYCVQASVECSNDVKPVSCDETRPIEAAAVASEATSEVETGDATKDDTGGTCQQESATASTEPTHAEAAE